MENIREANRGKIDLNSVVLNRIQHEIDQIRSDHEVEVHATKVKYDKLVSEVYSYHRQVCFLLKGFLFSKRERLQCLTVNLFHTNVYV